MNRFSKFFCFREEPRILCDRADAYLAEDMFDEAVNDYRRAQELDEDFGRAKEGLATAQKRQKQASKRCVTQNK